MKRKKTRPEVAEADVETEEADVETEAEAEAEARAKAEAEAKTKTSRLLTFPELLALKGIRYSRVSLTRLMRERRFPQSVRVSNARIAWWEHEIDAHLASLKRGGADKPAKKERA
jgi:predicted DNA-binding transcriptional regulator AlpA